MLQKLYISNYALIDRLDIDFSDGLNVITGETGAGKSIIMGALALIMGARTDSSSVREGATKCIVEATFTAALTPCRDGACPVYLQNLLSDFDIDDELILRREMTTQGKSRAFINDTPVNLQQLKTIASSILDIHSQHQNLLLEREDFQLNVIDTVADNHTDLANYQSAYKHYKELCRQLTELREAVENSAKERDYDLFQYNQLKEAKLAEGEQEALEEELSRLEHAEEIKSELSTASELFDNEEGGVVPKLKDIVSSLRKAAKYLTEANDLADAVNERYLDLRELANDIDKALSKTVTDEPRRAQVEARLGEIYDLEQKHRVKTCTELLAIQNELKLKLESVEHRDEEIKRLEMECADSESVMKKQASALSLKRHNVKQTIEHQLVDSLIYLGITNAKIEISITNRDCSLNGADEVEFRFSANLNTTPQPISKIASGGEMARVMLALKTIMAERQGLQTIIFDEIDTGVSGEMAGRMGEMMQKLSAHAQVIAITHLPQIAAKGATHYKVYKQDFEHSTVTKITRLSDNERVTEIAEMLSGHNPTTTAIRAAKELINVSRR